MKKTEKALKKKMFLKQKIRKINKYCVLFLHIRNINQI